MTIYPSMQAPQIRNSDSKLGFLLDTTRQLGPTKQPCRTLLTRASEPHARVGSTVQMKRASWYRLLGSAWFCGVLTLSPISIQAASSPIADIIGLKLGMSYEEVVTTLKARKDFTSVETADEWIREGHGITQNQLVRGANGIPCPNVQVQSAWASFIWSVIPSRIGLHRGKM